MSSNIREARRELEDLERRIQRIEIELPRTRRLLTDITTLMSLAGIKGTSDIRRQITLLYQLKAAYDAVQLSRLAAGDPLAWISTAVTVTATLVSYADMMEGY